MASDQTINTIAKALGEADEGPLAQIKAVVDNLGEQACLTLLAETEKIEKAGGSFTVLPGRTPVAEKQAATRAAKGKTVRDNKSAKKR